MDLRLVQTRDAREQNPFLPRCTTRAWNKEALCSAGFLENVITQTITTHHHNLRFLLTAEHGSRPSIQKVLVPGVTQPNKEPDCQGATHVASHQQQELSIKRRQNMTRKCVHIQTRRLLI